ncbi:MAG TPA: Crp/Fnr family transcriptional regulator [Candidatus Heimdallarchaeota archaeon]|nr:Crp/Fnr family transcriptional regulator [Candidatus Heimdallarchaeota archaeon]
MTINAKMIKERREFLADAFPSLQPAEIVELQRISLAVSYDKGELIAQEGSYAAGVYVVQSGLVSIGKYASKGWEKRTLRFLAVGEMFGLETVFLERDPVNVQFAKALTESSLVFFERSNILAFSKTHPRLFADLCRWLSREVIMLEFKLTRETVESIGRNLALLLMALANKYGEKEGTNLVVELPVPRQTLAEMIGVSIETLMRALKQFRERGLIETAQNRIIITDLEGLKEKARITSFYLSILEETL